MEGTQYRSDRKKSAETYKKTWRRHASFGRGTALLSIAVLGTAYDLYNMAAWIAYGCGYGNILIHVLIAAVLAACAALAAYYAGSGGRRQLMKRASTGVTVYPDHISIRFSLLKSEKKKARAVRVNAYYCDIDRMTMEAGLSRIRIDGEYTIEAVPPDGKSFDDAEIREVSGRPLYIYDQFRDFEKMAGLIEEYSYKSIDGFDKL